MSFKGLFISICCLILMACSDASEQLNQDYGSPQTRDRLLPVDHPLAVQFEQQVQPVIEKRCVVCHGCYDAPCQLKLSSAEGIDRGASKAKVYNSGRILAADPTRLFIDASSSEQWREKGFSAVLNERDQTLLANLQGSVLYQLLVQKNKHKQPEAGRLPEEFNYHLNRVEQCPTLDTLDEYQEDYPLAGMPYGLPNLSKEEFKVLETWVGQGAPMSQPPALSAAVQHAVTKWESKLNDNSLKAQLSSRYIYEHLFLAHLYFDEITVEEGLKPLFFRLVRSSTAPGFPIQEIATRRPYDAPETDNVYYRLRLDPGTVLSKTHMPYALNSKREKRWDELFYKNDFEVEVLPDYRSASPFVVFQAIPSYSRYSFMLDEAFFTISGFIKGPVCRGSIALNVINDNFWVFFVNPELETRVTADQFILQQADNLRLPSETSSETLSVRDWLGYAAGQTRYIKAKSKFIEENMDLQSGLQLTDIWSGNENSALTVFRHFDSASVVKGSVGKQPKTAWIIDYPVLERIHYLLVAGYDVFGNIGHQLTTRLYMDFLRIESEMNFISFLPNESRPHEMASWYLDSTSELANYLEDQSLLYSRPTGISYQTPFVKEELLSLLKNYVYNSQQKIDNNFKYMIPLQDLSLKRLNALDNRVVRELPEMSFILIESEKGKDRLYTLLRHNAHKNVSSLLNEKANRLPLLDTAGIYKGLIGNYPSLIFRVHERDKLTFINQLTAAKSSARFTELLSRFSVRRTNPEFWQISDKLHQLHFQADPISYGLFDYNRLENR
ncbi:fatty acid cis/trans isomerase [Psychromonas aquimarina]|uniref:fatty acid cis/trans isomerase n=1 Tax=Psychromonas aquimarina TaxID=444919 RepID=UPI0003FB1457|nr:fatty acid cis/trans isomerase [Psychromonas aquimarina]